MGGTDLCQKGTEQIRAVASGVGHKGGCFLQPHPLRVSDTSTPAASQRWKDVGHHYQQAQLRAGAGLPRQRATQWQES